MSWLKFLFPKLQSKKQVSLVFLFVFTLLIALSFYGYLNINFFVNEDMVIRIEPSYVSFDEKNNATAQVQIDLTVNNHWLCSNECEVKFYDVSNDNVLYTELIQVPSFYQQSYFFNLTPSGMAGQDVYNFETTCINIETPFCQARTLPVTRKNLITVNYDLTDEQEIQRNVFLESLESYKEVLRLGFWELEKSHKATSVYSFDFSSYFGFIDYYLDEFELKESIFSLRKDEYSSYVFNSEELENELENMKDIYTTSVLITEPILNYPSLHNELIDTLFVSNSVYTTSNLIGYDATNYVANAVSANSLLNERDAYNYNFLLELQEDLNNYSFSQYINLTNDPNLTSFVDFLSLTQRNLLNQTQTSYFNESLELNEARCELILNSNLSHPYINQTISLSNKLHYLESLNYTSSWKERYENFLINEIQINNLTRQEYEEVNVDYNDVILTPLLQDYQASCSSINEDLVLTQSKVDLDIVSVDKRNYEIVHPEPICCAFGACDKCYSNQRRPLILVHGHAFSRESTPDYSTDVFNDLIFHLNSEELYISGGLVSQRPLGTFIQRDLGKSPLPFVFKTTYYYTSFWQEFDYIISISKSENIDTYSERLDEIVQEVKYATGSEKVDIVAHSMGGLVSRNYLRLYGEDSVENLILVGAPNKGITDRVYSLCTLFGVNKECQDMYKESSFIATLNEAPPPSINVVNIIGEGCDMGRNPKGDGVVTVENAELDFATNYYFEGICEPRLTLHSAMLKPSKYPEIYSVIKKELGLI